MIRIISRNGKEFISVHTKMSIFQEGKPKIEVPIVVQVDLSSVDKDDIAIIYKCIAKVFDKPYTLSFKPHEKPVPKKNWIQKLFGK